MRSEVPSKFAGVLIENLYWSVVYCRKCLQYSILPQFIRGYIQVNFDRVYYAYLVDLLVCGTEWVRASIGDRTIDGSTPTAGDFEFGTLAIPLTLLCQCLSDETLKAVGPFYLVSMPGEVKDPTSPHWNV